MDKKPLQWMIVIIVIFVSAGYGAPRSSNPIIRHMFTADPSAHVWGDGRLYVYPSTDVAPPRGCDLMDGYHVFSTDDMAHWTDHGQILHSRDVEWGRPEGGFMWAPDCAYKNGTYYYYFPHPSGAGDAWRTTWKIGVATSSSPAGGFTLHGYIEGLGGDGMIDPCVFVDDDGQAYMIYGGSGKCFAVKLKDNMVEIDGEMTRMQGLNDYHEGPWVFKRRGVYYLIYPDNYSPYNRMQYAISSSPLGPWQSKGVFLDSVSSETTHGSVVQYKGRWYLFYHNASLSGGIGNLRSVCFDSLFFNDDGTIQKVKQTLDETYQNAFSVDVVTNGSFEKGIDLFIYGWRTNTTNFSHSAHDPAEGSYCLKYEGSSTQTAVQTIKLSPNKHYEVGVWMKIEPGSRGEMVFDTEDKFDDTCQFIMGANDAGKWVHKTGAFYSADQTRLTLRCFTTDKFDGICYWDNVTLSVCE